MTARAAVTRLVADGLVYRQSGRGTFVAVPVAHRSADSLVRFSAEMRRQGRKPGSRLIERERRPATGPELDRLRLPRAAQVIVVRRVRLADDEPVALETALFPGTITGLLDADLVTGSLHAALVALGHVPTAGHATLNARAADREAARLLGVRAGSALLVEQRLILDQHSKPLELTTSSYVGDRYTLEVTFEVQP
jgi:GntR family transcriptional regulator